MKKPKLLLLDANVVLIAYRLGLWDQLKAKYEVYVTSIVADIEVKYVKTENSRVAVDLRAQEENGEIHIVEANATEMASATANFAEAFRQALDSGEIEGIAVMLRGELEGCSFCTGDTNGLQALGMLNLGECSISFEDVLEQSGLRSKLPMTLPPEFTRRNYDIQLKAGTGRRITGEYFKKSPLAL